MCDKIYWVVLNWFCVVSRKNDTFGLFRVVLACFGSFWLVSDRFGLFRVVFACFGSFWLDLACFEKKSTP